MRFDNAQFVVNGDMDDQNLFVQTLKLAFDCSRFSKVLSGYKIDDQKGFILIWDKDAKGLQKFPFGESLPAVAHYIWCWLQSNPKIKQEQDEARIDMDGSCEPGWKVYCETGGGVSGHPCSLIAIKPIFCWYHK